MRKLLTVTALVAGIALGGCAGTMPSINLSNSVAMNTVYGVENAYGVAISAANAYKALPLCRTGTRPSAANICAKRSVIVNLQAATVKARAAVNNMVSFQKAYPTLDISNVLSAAQVAVSDLQMVLATSGGN